jgi:hypothetical protein
VYVSIRALRARQQDARRPDGSFAEVDLATTTMQGVGFFLTQFGEKSSRGRSSFLLVSW